MATRQDQTIDWDWNGLRAQSLREAQRVLGRTAEAEDAAQEAVTRAWLKRHACAAEERPGPWVRTIARREALRIAAGRRDAPLEDVPEPVSGGELEPLLERAAVRRAVAALDHDERRLLLATYWEDLSGAELSRRLGCPEATVRVRLHRTRGRLRGALGDLSS